MRLRTALFVQPTFQDLLSLQILILYYYTEKSTPLPHVFKSFYLNVLSALIAVKCVFLKFVFAFAFRQRYIVISIFFRTFDRNLMMFVHLFLVEQFQDKVLLELPSLLHLVSFVFVLVHFLVATPYRTFWVQE